jgi:hypothetical protein
MSGVIVAAWFLMGILAFDIGSSLEDHQSPDRGITFLICFGPILLIIVLAECVRRATDD